MASSLMDAVGQAVVGVWRAHTALDESDEADCSPEAPDRFRKLRSSSSLNSLRMSLRKRTPLCSVQSNSLAENPTWENTKGQPKPSTVRKMTRSARNSITEVCQVGRARTLLVSRCSCVQLVFTHAVLSCSAAATEQGVCTRGVFGGDARSHPRLGRSSCVYLSHP